MARRPSYRDEALVIRTYDFGEADRVIVLLTKDHGIQRAVAKGVRRSRSRFGSRLQPFVVLSVVVYPGRGLGTITEADTVNYLAGAIIADYERYTAACAVLETAERLIYADAASSGDNGAFAHVTTALALLQHTPFPTLALDGFILQGLQQAGWEPQLFHCAQCGAPGPHRAFHPALGGAACTACRPTGSDRCDEETLHLMWLIQRGYQAHAEATVRQNPVLEAEVHQLTRAHLQWHLETRMTSLRVMDEEFARR